MSVPKLSFIKHTSLLFSGSLLAQAIGFFILFFLSRIYNPEDFGGLGLFNSIVATITVFSGMRYEMAIVVESDDEKAKDLTQLAAILNIGIGTICLLLIIFFKTTISDFFQISNSNWLYLVPPVVSLSGLMETLVLWYNREKKYAKISSNRIITASSSAAIKSVYPFAAILKGNGLIMGHSLAQLFGFIHLYYKSTFKLVRLNPKRLKQIAKEYLHFPLYSAPAALVNILAVNMPFFFLSTYDGMSATGYLSNASRLSYLPMSMLAMASSQVFFERIARIKNDKKQSAEVSHQLFNFLFLLGLIPVSILFVFGDSIVPWVLGPQWTEAGVYVQILILFYFSMYLTSPFSSAFETYNKLKVQLIYNITFLAFSSLALYIGYIYFEETRQVLWCFSITALILRIIVLNYFFHLFGKHLIVKSIIGAVLLVVTIWILQLIKYQF